MENTTNTIKSFIFEGNTSFTIICDDKSCKILGDSLFNAIQDGNSVIFKTKPLIKTTPVDITTRSWYQYFFGGDYSTIVVSNGLFNDSMYASVNGANKLGSNYGITINGTTMSVSTDVPTGDNDAKIMNTTNTTNTTNRTNVIDGDYRKEHILTNPIKLTDICLKGYAKLTLRQENSNIIANNLNCVTSDRAYLNCNFLNFDFNHLKLQSSDFSGLEFKSNSIDNLSVESNQLSCTKISCTQPISKAKLTASWSSEIISNTSIIDADIESRGSSKINSFCVTNFGKIRSNGSSCGGPSYVDGNCSKNSIINLQTSNTGIINIRKQIK